MGIASEVHSSVKWPAATLVVVMLLAFSLWATWVYRHHERAARDLQNNNDPANVTQESDTVDARAAWAI